MHAATAVTRHWRSWTRPHGVIKTAQHAVANAAVQVSFFFLKFLRCIQIQRLPTQDFGGLESYRIAWLSDRKATTDTDLGRVYLKVTNFLQKEQCAWITADWKRACMYRLEHEELQNSAANLKSQISAAAVICWPHLPQHHAVVTFFASVGTFERLNTGYLSLRQCCKYKRCHCKGKRKIYMLQIIHAV